MKIEYTSNNSGGDWWLSDEHWLKLEKAGWSVDWGGRSYCHSRWPSLEEGRAPDTCASNDVCPGHQNATSLAEAKEKKLDWLGCYTKRATGEFDSLADAIRSWEKATGLEASDEGCNCCGAPHSFIVEDRPDIPFDEKYASGDRIVDVLYPGAPKSRRAAAEGRK